jgi:zinc protease
MTGMPGCSNLSADRFAVELLQTALNGQASRLFKTIRDDAGLAYYTGMSLSLGLHPGFIAFYAGTAPESAGYVAELIERERKLLAEKGISDIEFETSVVRIKADLAALRLNPGSIMYRASLSEFYGNGYMAPWNILSKFASLTVADVNAVAEKYLLAENRVTIIAGGEETL